MFFQSVYSILQSSIGVKKGVSRLKELGYTTGIIVDNELFGTMEFLNECKKNQIKPIIGVQKTFNEVDFVIIAQNQKGYKNIIELISTNGDIYSYQNNCIFIITNYLNKESAEEAATSLDNVYAGIKLTENASLEQKIKRLKIEKLSKDNELEIIPLEIGIHLNKEDYRYTNALRAIGGKIIYDNVAIKDSTDPTDYILSKEELIEKYPKEWIFNLGKIVSSCEDDYKFGNPIPPQYIFVKETANEFGYSEDISEDDLFAELSRKGLEERLNSIEIGLHDKYRERLEFEINIIQKMKFSGYMLIVWDYVKAAHEKNIPVGPGRGSAAGSLVAFALKITDIDPIRWNLLFERFLNPERVSMPDIDIDFCQTRRQEVLDYVARKYGSERVAQIATFTGLDGRGLIRDMARIFSYPKHKADVFAKTIPEQPGMTLELAYENETSRKEIDSIISDSKEAERIWTYANKLKGAKRGLGLHAAGVVISEEPIYKRAPIIDVNGVSAVQFEGKYLEDVDLIKFDFLGLKTLSVIDMAIKFIKQNRGIDIDIRGIDLYDQKVYDYISTGNTVGIFQIESPGMQELCRRVRPTNFEDLIAILALYRPGPMDAGMLEDFIERKNGIKEIKYFFDEFENILKPTLETTYGVIVYQEQVMQIVQDVGGFSLGEADIIRRAMGKKQAEYMQKKSSEFADGAVKKGLPRRQAEELFKMIEKFAGYGFNKSHSAAYAMITYQTAWLKKYYPVELLSALANFEIGAGDIDIQETEEIEVDKKKKGKGGNQDALVKYIADARKMGIVVTTPDINSSMEIFTPSGDQILFGLRGIKGIGAGCEAITKSREEGKFTNLKDFVSRVKSKLNKRIFESLIKAGALDSLGISRKVVLEHSQSILKGEEISLDHSIDFSNEEKLLLEKEKLNFYITDPFSYEQRLVIMGFDIPNYELLQNGTIKLIGLIEDITIKMSKKGSQFVIVKLYMDGQSIEILGFNDMVDKVNSFAITSKVIVTVDNKNGNKFLQNIQPITKRGLEMNFPAKQEVVSVIKQPDFIDIQFGDFNALKSAEKSPIPVRLLTDSGDVYCTLYR